MSQTDSILHTDSLLANFWNIRVVLLFERADTIGRDQSLEKAVSIQTISILGNIGHPVFGNRTQQDCRWPFITHT